MKTMVWKRNWPKNNTTPLYTCTTFKPVPLYGCEIWGEILYKTNAYENHKYNIAKNTPNKTVKDIAITRNISFEITRRRWT